MSLHLARRERLGPPLYVRLPLPQHQVVTDLAAEHGATPSDILRALIADALERAELPADGDGPASGRA